MANERFSPISYKLRETTAPLPASGSHRPVAVGAASSGIWSLIWRRPRAIEARRWIFWLHLWAGLIAALYVIVIGVSGSALVFREELERGFRPRLSPVDGMQADIDGAVAAFRATRPGWDLTWLRLPDAPTAPLEVWLEKGHQRTIDFIHPASGAVLSANEKALDLLHWFVELHFNLLAGRTGRIVNSAGAAALLFLAVSGMILWWPGIASWRRGLTVLWTARPPRLNYDLHRAAGFWTLALLLAWALSGINFGFAKEFRAVVAKLLPMHKAEKLPAAPPLAGTAIASYASLVRAAELAVPNATTTWVRGNDNPKRLALVYRVPPGQEGVAAGFTSVYLHPRNAQVLAVRPPERRLAGDSFMHWLIRLHFGDFGGPLVKALWVLLGLTPPLLAVTGILAWWYRSASKKLRARHHAASA